MIPVILLALGSLQAAVVIQQPHPATITGMVHDSSGAPVAGATVFVKNTTEKITQLLSTEKDGRYSITDLLEGRYEIETQAAGYRTARLAFPVEKGDSLRRDFVLQISTAPSMVSDPGALQPELLDVPDEGPAQPCPCAAAAASRPRPGAPKIVIKRGVTIKQVN
jgi:Carboxypeptidase regulatory-like domain